MPNAEIFGEARRLARWHDQWAVLHEFLPLLVGHELMEAAELSRCDQVR